MGKLATLVMGPAGSGKSTYCSTMINHLNAAKRSSHLVNLDPAANTFEFKPSIDIKDLVSLDEVMDELQYGPNGGLVFCLEYLVDNLDWFFENLGDFSDDYLIIDCPGQIELYTHIPVMRRLVDELQRIGYRVCGVYLLDSQFIQDTSKFFSGVLSAMSAMVTLEIPHINVMSKMDLISSELAESAELDRYFDPDSSLLLEDLNSSTRPKFRALNEALARMIDEYNMVSFIPLDITKEDSIEYVLSHVDNAIQYGEDVEPKEPRDVEYNED